MFTFFHVVVVIEKWIQKFFDKSEREKEEERERERERERKLMEQRLSWEIERQKSRERAQADIKSFNRKAHGLD